MRQFAGLLLLPMLLGAADLKDVEFARPAGVPLLLDAFIPDSKTPQPVVVVVHGGGWERGDRRTFVPPILETLTNAGFAWVSVDYRLSPQFQFPAAIEDVEAALAWVVANARKYGFDTKRIALVGESAGGQIVSFVAARGKTPVRALVPFYGLHDLPAVIVQRGQVTKTMAQYLGSTDPKEASAVTFLTQKMPPTLCIHGTADAAVGWQQSQILCDAMKSKGASCETFFIEGAPHGVGPWEKNPAWQTYKPKLVEWLRAQLK